MKTKSAARPAISPVTLAVRYATALLLGTGIASATAGTLGAVKGPLAVTEESQPWLASSRTQNVVDLEKAGYVEEEYIISGTANIYDRAAAGGVEVLIPDAPYTTRIIVRRPADPARFNGSVAVEPLNEARGYDWSFLWAMSYQHFIDNGMAWVGITHMPQNVDVLKAFDPARYGELSFANPNPAETCGQGNTASPTEEGLHWDIYTHVGELLKSDAANAPMAGLDVEYVYMTSHHGQSATYAAEFQRDAKLANGAPVYDGYLLPGWDLPMRLRRCGTAPAAGEPRQIISKVGVPVIRFVPQGEVMNGYATRRPDSDDPADRYRQYEIPGAPRMDRIYFQHLPAVEDQQKAGVALSVNKWPFNYNCSPDIELLDFQAKRVLINGGWANLDRWVRTGEAPPHAEPIAVVNQGTPQAEFATDEFGNVQGGVRHTWVEVPTATYYGSTAAPCGNLARKEPFSWSQLQTLYGSPDNYAAKAEASVDQMVAERWITEGDAARMKAEMNAAALGR